ncbi:RagB/SusD family nutrient uptake outer membrane protein [Sphingobacterium sp. LRF_L2]|uniref:RagB/SusD family nutrient uptake outer membrane protein n=1 Tax=Sphingobacterium sp. LRF_L2 TaxID=3369421 RepID=UPI003F63BB83
MNAKNRLNICLAGCMLVFNVACTDLSETVYSEINTTNFYTTRDEVMSAVLRPYTHSRAVFAAQSRENVWRMNEFSADQLAWPQKGIHGYDSGKWIQFHYHTWNDLHATISGAWSLLFQGLGYCNSGIEGLEAREATDMGITEEEKAAFIAELRANRAYYYLQALGTFGNVPIVTTVGDPEYPATNTQQEVFDFVESEMLVVINDLPEMNSGNSGRFTQIAGYAMLADLYLNAETWTGTARLTDCLTYCNKVLASEGGGQHGAVALDENILTPFGTQNTESSNENILVISYDYQASGDRCNWASDFYHFAQRNIDGGNRNGNNGVVVVPSAYDAFDDKDLRKKEWMLIGTQYYQSDPATTVKGTVEYAGEPLVFVKEIRLNKSGGTESTMYTGEENSGARFNKYRGGITTADDFCNNDYVLYRLAEFYLMKAEVLMRQNGNSATSEAVELVNTIRMRAFTESDWATGNYAYTVNSLTMNELLAEKGREFIFEGKRRIDLIRFGKFLTGSWWDHEPTASEHLELFPIPNSQLAVNPNLIQNSGY